MEIRKWKVFVARDTQEGIGFSRERWRDKFVMKRIATQGTHIWL